LRFFLGVKAVFLALMENILLVSCTRSLFQ
jgi:hypothetical protein